MFWMNISRMGTIFFWRSSIPLISYKFYLKYFEKNWYLIGCDKNHRNPEGYRFWKGHCVSRRWRGKTVKRVGETLKKTQNKKILSDPKKIFPFILINFSFHCPSQLRDNNHLKLRQSLQFFPSNFLLLIGWKLERLSS